MKQYFFNSKVHSLVCHSSYIEDYLQWLLINSTFDLRDAKRYMRLSYQKAKNLSNLAFLSLSIQI